MKTASISTEEVDFQVGLMARRAAWLYYFMAKKLIDRLGEEAGREAVREAIRDYGLYCGDRVREEARDKGLSLSLESYDEIPDLPKFAWKAKTEREGGTQRTRITFCPMAAAWQEMGADDLGRLYCGVDQAKYAGFDPKLECVHTKNVLDGDDICELVVERRHPR